MTTTIQPMRGIHADPDEMRRALTLLLGPGQVTELRALGVLFARGQRPHVESGYFDDPEALIREAVRLAPAARGIYIVPNTVNPALLARARNRARPVGADDPLTSDGDVMARRWLLVDLDPRRPAGISSTDAEHEAALTRAREVRAALAAEGWPEPLLADSGNGAHLLYRVDLAADDGSLVRGALETLAFRFDDDLVAVDQKVFNPARIWKLYGTTARKGDDTPDRPHRLARILEVPCTPS